MAEEPNSTAPGEIELSLDSGDTPLEVEGRGQTEQTAQPTFEGTTVDLGLDLLEGPTRVVVAPTPQTPMASEDSPALPVPMAVAPTSNATPTASAPFPPQTLNPVGGQFTGASPWPAVLEGASLGRYLSEAWELFYAGELSTAKTKFRRLAISFPESSDALLGLERIQEKELDSLRNEGVFEEASAATQAASEGEGENSWIPQEKKDASERHAAELQSWEQEQRRIETLNRLESWCGGSLFHGVYGSSGSSGEEGAFDEEEWLERFLGEAAALEPRSRVDLGIALFEIGLFTGVRRVLAPLLQLEGPTRGESVHLSAEAALAEGRPWEAIQVLDAWILSAEPSEDFGKVPYLYLRGLASLGIGAEREALSYFRGVVGANPDYRDAAARLKLLQARVEWLDEIEERRKKEEGR
jgi:tetratricopeptide (TPR) repeat protein